VTPDQIERVSSVVADVGTHPEFAPRFYERLSAAEPVAADVFIDLRDGQDLTHELEAMTGLLSDIAALDARARDIGARHRRHGVRAAHYRVARTVMIDTLHEVLGDEFGPEDEEAWNRAAFLITELLQAS
jgi:hemoglobin-like flavoprotein